jgi:hypothetical protein
MSKTKLTSYYPLQTSFSQELLVQPFSQPSRQHDGVLFFILYIWLVTINLFPEYTLHADA